MEIPDDEVEFEIPDSDVEVIQDSQVQVAQPSDRSYLDTALGGNFGAGAGLTKADVPNLLFSIPNGLSAGALRILMNQPLAGALGGLPGAAVTEGSNVIPGSIKNVFDQETADVTGAKEPSPKSGIAPEAKTFAGSAVSGQIELLSGLLGSKGLDMLDDAAKLRSSAEIQAKLNTVQDSFDYTKDLARNSVKIEDARLQSDADTIKTGLQSNLQQIESESIELGNEITKKMRASKYWDYQRGLSERYGKAVEPFLNEKTGVQIPIKDLHDELVQVYADKGIQYKLSEGIPLSPEEKAFNGFFEKVSRWRTENESYAQPAGRLVSEFRAMMKPFQNKPWSTDLLTDVNHAVSRITAEYIPELKPINAQFASEFKNRNTLRHIFQPFEKTTLTERGSKFIRDAATGNLASSPSKQEFFQWLTQKFPEDMAPVAKFSSNANSLKQEASALDSALQQTKAQSHQEINTFLANRQAQTANKTSELSTLLKEAQAREARNEAIKKVAQRGGAAVGLGGLARLGFEIPKVLPGND